MTTQPIKKIDPREVCRDAFYTKITDRILTDHPTFDREMAERITDAGVAFLYTAARTTEPLSPSPMADIAWHTMLLHTAEYAAWCDTYAGHFVHHEPAYLDAAEHGGAKAVRDRTVSAMKAQGFSVDTELWPEVASCHQCHAGCHDSPKK